MKERIIQSFSWERFIYLLQNPRENPQETVLAVGILVALLLVLLITILLIHSIIKTPPQVKVARKRGIGKKFWLTIGTILLVICLGTSIFFLAYSSQPSYCRSCHQMQKEYKSWMRSSHQKVTCLACHQKPGLIGWAIMKTRINRMILLTAAKRYQKPITTRVDNISCIQCHHAVRKKTVSRYGIKMSHKEPQDAGFRCADCHNTAGHQKVVGAHYPSMNDCIQCHTGEKVSAKCSLCHTKDIGVKPRARAVDYPKVHLEPLTDCRGCHPIEKCTRCHGIEMPHPPGFSQPESHARLADFEEKNLCQKCHNQRFCNECHRFPTPHSPNWKTEHGQATRGKGSETCIGCHNRSQDFCGLCH